MQTTSPSRHSAEFLSAFERTDWPQMIMILDREWPTILFRQETFNEGFSALANAPEELLRAKPLVAMLAEAIGRFPPGTTPFTLPRGDGRIEEAVRHGHARGLLERSVVAMMAHRVACDPHRAVEIAEASRPLLAASTLTIFSPGATIAGYWHLQAGKAAVNTGDIERARLDFELAWIHRATDITGQTAFEVAPYMAVLALLDGDTATYESWRNKSHPTAAGSDRIVDPAAITRPLRMAELLTRTPGANDAESTALVSDLSAELAFDEIWPATLWAVVRHHCAAGDVTAAERLVTTTVALRPTPPQSGHSQALFIAAARAEIALALGQPDVAHRQLGASAGTFAMLRDLCDRIDDALAGERPAEITLTPSERRVLAVITHPGPLSEAAQILHISPNTLKTHLRSLYAKLGVASRSDAIDRASELGLSGNMVGPRAQ